MKYHPCRKWQIFKIHDWQFNGHDTIGSVEFKCTRCGLYKMLCDGGVVLIEYDKATIR